MGRNQELNQKMRDERREQILSAGLFLFSSRGLAATKISDISKKAEISQGLLYHYFGSKEEIFTELIKTAFERLNDACRQLEKHPDAPAAKIQKAIKAILEGLEKSEDHARYHLLIAQATASDAVPAEAKKIIEEENQFPYQVMARIFRKGQKEGSIKKQDPKQQALVFWTAIKGLAIHRAAHRENFKAPNPEILSGMFLKEE